MGPSQPRSPWAAYEGPPLMRTFCLAPFPESLRPQMPPRRPGPGRPHRIPGSGQQIAKLPKEVHAVKMQRTDNPLAWQGEQKREV